ncbi:MAG: Verru_Chthon cassette protein D [Candidatus Methylacidiphilales bacterium]
MSHIFQTIHRPDSKRLRAFTLFELMMVMAVVAAIAVLAVPAFSSMQRSSSLTRCEEEVLGEFNLARQQAISLNREVEVRFYLYRDKSLPGNSRQFNGIQSFTYSQDGKAAPIRIMRNLPVSAIIDGSATLSSLLGPAQKKNWITGDPQPQLPGIGTEYDAYVFRFRPDGGTDLLPFPATPWFLTLHDRAAGDNLSAPPANYISIVVDPISGQAGSYRP